MSPPEAHFHAIFRFMGPAIDASRSAKIEPFAKGCASRSAPNGALHAKEYEYANKQSFENLPATKRSDHRGKRTEKISRANCCGKLAAF
jgi:hypothetical protein